MSFRLSLLLWCMLILFSISSDFGFASPQEVTVPTDMFPPPGKYISDSGNTISFPIGVQMRNLVLRDIPIVGSLPAGGSSMLYNFNATMGFDLSMDGGATFQYKQGNVSATWRVDYLVPYANAKLAHIASIEEKKYYDVEILQMDIAGGTIPSFMHIRESPTLASLGNHTIIEKEPGVFWIDSFFDIFTEVSLDGGLSWPQANKAIRNHNDYPADSFFDVFYIPLTGEYQSSSDRDLYWGSGDEFEMKNISFHDPSSTILPPPLGATHTHSYGWTVDFKMSIDGGMSWTDGNAPCNATVSAYHDTDDVSASFFDTEMLQLDITGGSLPMGMLIRESPTLASTGKINARTAGGGYMISSFFDIFTEVSFDGGLSWTPATGPPLTVEMKHEVEIDTFPHTLAQMTLQYPDMSVETINLTGPTTVFVDIPNDGTAEDTDQDGLDQVPTEILSMNLTGFGSIGPVTMTLDSRHRTVGEIEENANNTPGKLDLPPFAVSGSASSFFDVFFEVTVGQMQLYGAMPAHMQVTLKHKPPLQGETYVMSPFPPIPLVDIQGNPTGITLLEASHTPNPVVEIDHFPHSFALVEVQFPGGTTELMRLTGPTTVEVVIPPSGQAWDYDGDGRDQVPTEMVQMNLTGTSPTLGSVNLRMRNSMSHPYQRTIGEIEETANMTPGTLDLPPFTFSGTAESFFDVFFEIETGGMVLHNDAAKRMERIITHKPPALGEGYENYESVGLFDEDENPTGISIRKAIHIPNPGEIDYFRNTTSQIELIYPGPSTEIIQLNGTSTVQVMIPEDGSATDSDADGLDDVKTEMLQMDLTGNSSVFGAINVSLREHIQSPFQKTTGMIEEMVNSTPGKLDLPPFTPSGTANSFFDVFIEINFPQMKFHNGAGKNINETITYKPAAPGETWEGSIVVQLLDENNLPTGIQMQLMAYTPISKITRSRDVPVGWSMLSVPLTVDDYTKTTLFPTAISDAFAYEGSYVIKDILANMVGYWMKFDRAQTISITGYERLKDTAHVIQGWNMVGSISSPIPVCKIISIPAGIFASDFFSYDNSYLTVDTLKPIHGYWIKMSSDGDLVYPMDGYDCSPLTNRIKNISEGESPPAPPELAIRNPRNEIPSHFALDQNYPNPFNPSTIIKYQLPPTAVGDNYVTLRIYNMLGQEVMTLVDGMQMAGYKSVEFNADNLPSGIYTYRLTAGTTTDVKKMMILK